MKIVQIPKRKGEFRTIYIPSPKERADLRVIAGRIARKVTASAPENVVHGFHRGRSPVTNAMAHVGHCYSLTMDLKDFFDAVTPEMVRKRLTAEEIEKTFIDGAPRQGLPTSPAVANLAAIPLDRALLRGFAKRKWNVVYTRYADDMTFSFDEYEIAEPLQTFVTQTVKRCGFRVNERKTELLDSRLGRRKITGVMVDDNGVYPSRSMKRRLRAAKHQGNGNQINGLGEWCKVKPPKVRKTTFGCRDYHDFCDELKAVAHAWRLKISQKQIDAIPEKQTEWIDSDTVITGDAVYMLGMSTLTTGWVSCMAHPGGSHRRGSVFWALFPGTSLAALLSKKETEICGVKRRNMRARALIHTLRDGKRYYDRFYGNQEDIKLLKSSLEARDIKSIKTAPYGTKLVGNLPKRLFTKKPYLDSLLWGSGQLPDTREKVWYLVKK